MLMMDTIKNIFLMKPLIWGFFRISLDHLYFSSSNKIFFQCVKLLFFFIFVKLSGDIHIYFFKEKKIIQFSLVQKRPFSKKFSKNIVDTTLQILCISNKEIQWIICKKCIADTIEIFLKQCHSGLISTKNVQFLIQ